MSLTQRVAALRTGIEIALWRHGWAWPATAALALSAAGLQALVLEPGRIALAEARLELAREHKAALQRPVELTVTSDQQRLLALQTLLRQQPPADELVRRMAALAQAEQIALVQGDYQHQFHSTTQAVQVQVTQPVRASYPQLRRYIESVLRTIPNASLDQITARRESVGQSQLEARLRWSVWTQATPAPAVAARTAPREAGE